MEESISEHVGSSDSKQPPKQDRSADDEASGGKEQDGGVQQGDKTKEERDQRRELFFRQFMKEKAKKGRSSLLPQREGHGGLLRYEWANAVANMVRQQEAKKSGSTASSEPTQPKPAQANPFLLPQTRPSAHARNLSIPPFPRANGNILNPKAPTFPPPGLRINQTRSPTTARASGFPGFHGPPPPSPNGQPEGKRPLLVCTELAYMNNKKMNAPEEVIPRLRDLPKDHFLADGSVILQLQWVIAQVGYAHFHGTTGGRAVLVSDSWIHGADLYGMPRSVINWLTNPNGGGVLKLPASDVLKFWTPPSKMGGRL